MILEVSSNLNDFMTLHHWPKGHTLDSLQRFMTDSKDNMRAVCQGQACEQDEEGQTHPEQKKWTRAREMDTGTIVQQI